MSERKNPWFKFYAADWRSDAALHACSYAARGLWCEMIALMHHSSQYGYLLIGGTNPSTAELAQVTGGSEQEVGRLLTALESKQVFSRTPNGVIFCRRMVRDFMHGQEKRDAGLLGGNPTLTRGSVAKEERARRFRPSDSPVKAARIRAKGNGKCHWCQTALPAIGEGPIGFHCDYLVPVRDGGTSVESNLVACCADCLHDKGRTKERIFRPTDSDPAEFAVGSELVVENLGGLPMLDEPKETIINKTSVLPESQSSAPMNSDHKPDLKAKMPEARSQSISYRSRSESPRPRRIGGELYWNGSKMPTLNSTPDEWLVIADGLGKDRDGDVRPVVGGSCIDIIAFEICQAAGINGFKPGIDWMPLVGWLREGLDGNRQIVPAVKKAVAGNRNYTPPHSLNYFEAPIRAFPPLPEF